MNNFYEPGRSATIMLQWRRTLVLFIFIELIKKVTKLSRAKYN